ncbi:hypothetical protein ACFW81_27445 [Streptomyces angustmyceticus]|uniref:hypothetical protein n=1 Tax=Streptomyces angustmyceticus TaxID=285578 RepID=UPI00369F0FFC
MRNGLEVSRPRQHMLLSTPAAFLRFTWKAQGQVRAQLVRRVPNVPGNGQPLLLGPLNTPVPLLKPSAEVISVVFHLRAPAGV